MTNQDMENHNQSKPDQASHPFTAHPDHADAVNIALQEIQKLLIDQPDFATVFRSASSTEEVRLALLEHGIEISNESLWRHRGTLMKDGQPSWRG
jgi:hypothetical protein